MSVRVRFGAWLRSVRELLRTLRSPGSRDREFLREAEFHLESLAARFEGQGMTPAEAALAARRRFGNPELVRALQRDARGLRFFEETVDDLKVALRQLGSRPRVTLPAVLMLAIGTGAVTSIYGAVHGLLLHPAPFPDLDEIVVLGQVEPGGAVDGEGWAAPAAVRAWADSGAFERLAPLRPWFSVLTVDGESSEVIGYRTTPDLYAIWSVAPFLGRTPSADPDDREVVLSHRYWRTKFGEDPGIVGRRVHVGEGEYSVVGVMPRGVGYPMGTDLWGQLDLEPEQWTSHSSPRLRVQARLAEATSLPAARARMAAADTRLAATRPPEAPARVGAIESFLDSITYGSRPWLMTLLGAAILLQTLVCANVANLLLMQGVNRVRDVALRATLGASRLRLVRLLLIESLVLASLAATLGVVFAVWGSRAIRVSIQGEWWRYFFLGVHGVRVSGGVLAFATAATVGSVVVFGVYPALRASRCDLAAVLKQSSGLPVGGRTQGALVAAEIAIAAILIAATFAFVQASGSLASRGTGFDDNVLAMQLRPRLPDWAEPETRIRFVRDGVLALSSAPGVTAAATNTMPGSDRTRRAAVARRGSEEVSARLVAASEEYFDVLSVSMHAGRAFREAVDRDRPVAVVSAALAARVWPDESALGRELLLDEHGTAAAVVGVAADVTGRDSDSAYTVYRPYWQEPSSGLVLLLRADAGETAAVDIARHRLWALEPGLPLPEARTIAAFDAERAAPLMLSLRLLGAFTICAVLLSAAGIYAVAGYSAALRAQEMGIRRALGATGVTIGRHFLGRALLQSLAGLLLGMPLGYLAAQVVTGALGKFMLTQPEVSGSPAGLALILLLVAVAASFVPARRAARDDPARVLRNG